MCSRHAYRHGCHRAPGDSFPGTWGARGLGLIQISPHLLDTQASSGQVLCRPLKHYHWPWNRSPRPWGHAREQADETRLEGHVLQREGLKTSVRTAALLAARSAEARGGRVWGGRRAASPLTAHGIRGRSLVPREATQETAMAHCSAGEMKGRGLAGRTLPGRPAFWPKPSSSACVCPARGPMKVSPDTMSCGSERV